MAGEKVACHRDAGDDRFGETTGPELLGHHRGDFVPKLGAEFFIDALVADDSKLLGARRKIKQNGVAVPSPANRELLETACRAAENGITVDITSGDKDADLAGGPAFCLLNGLNNRSLVKLSEKIVSSHGRTTIFRSPLHLRSCRRHR